MAKNKKTRDFLGTIKGIVDYIAPKILASISAAQAAEKVMQNIENCATRIGERMLRKMFSFAVIGLGLIFLMFALFFSLKEFLGWSNSAAFFSIGMLMLAVGLLLRKR